MIHTKIVPAICDPSTWAALAAGITAAAVLPSPISYIVMALTVPGVLLKGGAQSPAVQ